MHFVDGQSHAVPLFISTHLLPLHFLYYRNVAVLMHDIYTHSAPPNIIDLFEHVFNIHSYNTRASKHQNLYTKRFDLEIQRNSLSVFGAKLWNELPVCLRELPKKSLKTKLTLKLFSI